MARDYDNQLMESVGVRRRRLRDAVLFGASRSRQTMDEFIGKTFAGIAVAAVVSAGCVGWAYLDRELAKQQQEQNPPAVVTPTPTPTPTVSPTWSLSPTPRSSTPVRPTPRTS